MKAKLSETYVLMISKKSCNPRKRYAEEDYNKVWEITFPPLTKDKCPADPVIIKAYVSGRQVNRTQRLQSLASPGNTPGLWDKYLWKSQLEKASSQSQKRSTSSVEEGRFSGHLITKQGIKADPSKVKEISDLQPPKSVSEILSLDKKKREKASSCVIRQPNITWGRVRIPRIGKAHTALVYAIRKLRRYFQAHPIKVLSDKPIKQILARPKKSGRIAKWAIELGEHETNQVNGLFEARKPFIKQYLEKGKVLLVSFPTYSIEHVKRDQNKKAYELSKLASMTFSKLAKDVLVEVLQKKSITQKEVINVTQEVEDNWTIPVQEFLQLGKLPNDS
uniref:Reverse transcriptase domain-containing protein n=1 Tax=Tanacetum cinerariifolium TaxID=118510 RepID=A0A699IQV2_TANCI|nr:reverse transcriptase domain-containing protein [Tanacetum cinerariifolium]